MGDLRREAAPYDGALETGLRALVVLEAMYPRPCDLQEMTWYDYLVVNSADIDGRDGEEAPESLHPALPGRQDALTIRREVVEESLRLMHRVHLVDVRQDEDGIRYVAGEDAPSFLDALRSPYIMRLKERAVWLADRFADMTVVQVAEVVDSHVGRWKVHFTGEAGIP